jgi:hypothetical protein
MRPIILNGIESFVSRTDLADRAIALTLMEIPEDKRQDEETFWADFNQAAPRILGALLTAVSHGLKHLPGVKLARKPRMADFAKWLTACEGGLPWEAGQFMKVYDINRADMVESILESDPVAVAVRALAATEPNGEWEGTTTDLLKALNNRVAEEVRKSKIWPQSPQVLAGALRRIAPGLRKAGLAIVRPPRASGGKSGGKRSRLLAIVPSEVGMQVSTSSPSSRSLQFQQDSGGHSLARECPQVSESVPGAAGHRDEGDTCMDLPTDKCPRVSPCNNYVWDEGDEGDTCIPTAGGNGDDDNDGSEEVAV